MKVIIAGSRSITDIVHVRQAIKMADYDITTIISGMARGVDTLGVQWAIENDIPYEEYPAIWRPNGIYNPNAGYERNVVMSHIGDLLICVWDGMSNGSNHMMKCMRSLNKPVYLHDVSIPPSINLFDLI